MPAFELKGSRRGRFRAFTRAQLPLLVATVFVSIEGAWALPALSASRPAVFGVVLVIVASGFFVALPWERWPVSFLIPLAVIDVVGVAFLRLAYFGQLPSVGILTVFPVIWLAYAFRRWAIALAIVGALFITALPVIVGRPFPAGALGVASVITLPAIVIGLAVAVGEAARQLAGSQRRTREANTYLRQSLAIAEDSQALTKMLIETMDVAIAFYGIDGQLIMANTRARQAVAVAGFDLDRQPHAGVFVRRANNVDAIPFEDQIIPRALRGDLEEHEMEWIGPPGSQIAIAASSVRVDRADGSQWGTLIAAYDITSLARALQVKDEFVATVSHELRTPLTSIVGYLEVLSDELEDSEVFIIDSLAAASRNAQKLRDRIEELLATADQRQNLHLSRLDLEKIVRTVVTTQSRFATTSDVVVSVDGDGPVWANVDGARFEQIVDNLLTNAIKYSPAGTVNIAVSEKDGSITLVISDDGIGMTPDDVAQAFDMFWRSERARSEAVQGIGIGLALVRRLVEAHQGSISIASTVGVGSTFTVTLPVTAS